MKGRGKLEVREFAALEEVDTGKHPVATIVGSWDIPEAHGLFLWLFASTSTPSKMKTLKACSQHQVAHIVLSDNPSDSAKLMTIPKTYWQAKVR